MKLIRLLDAFLAIVASVIVMILYVIFSCAEIILFLVYSLFKLIAKKLSMWMNQLGDYMKNRTAPN